MLPVGFGRTSSRMSRASMGLVPAVEPACASIEEPPSQRDAHEFEIAVRHAFGREVGLDKFTR
jgi:hypothetical protein